jgi:hypothetical protein
MSASLSQDAPPEIVGIIAQLGAAAPARQVVEEDIEDRLVLPQRMAGGMRRDDDVGHVPQWRGGIERLALEDVEIGAGKMAALKGRNDVAFDRDFTARDVDEMAAPRHRLEGRRVGDAARRGRGRAAQDQPVGLGQRLQQLAIGDGAVAGFDRLGAAMGADHRHAQHPEVPGNVATDRTQADDHRALAL